MPRTYKIRKFENGKNKSGDAFINYSLTLPTPTAEKVISQFGDGLEFEIELTEDGILYKPVVVEKAPDEIPFKPQTRTKAAAPAKTKPERAAAKPKAAAARAKPAAAPKTAPARQKPAAKPKAAAPKAKATAPKARPSAAKKGTGAKPAAPRAPRARPRAKAAA